MDPVKRRNILAQSTVESVTAFQKGLREKKKEQMEARDAEAAAAAVKGSATPQSAAPESQEDAPSKPPTPVYSFDQLLYL